MVVVTRLNNELNIHLVTLKSIAFMLFKLFESLNGPTVSLPIYGLNDMVGLCLMFKLSVIIHYHRQSIKIKQ